MKTAWSLAVAAVLVAGAVAFAQSKSSAAPKVQGVWRVTEVTRTGPSAGTNKDPQPGLYIFTARHYSMVLVNGASPRPALPQDPTSASPTDLVAVWGTAFTAQSGTYDLTGAEVTFRPIVAKNPWVMAPGAFSTESYKLDGKTLSLTNKSTNTGPVANPSTITLTRIE